MSTTEPQDLIVRVGQGTETHVGIDLGRGILATLCGTNGRRIVKVDHDDATGQPDYVTCERCAPHYVSEATSAETYATVTGSRSAKVTQERVTYDADGTRHVELLSEEHWQRVGSRSDAEQTATDELVRARLDELAASAMGKLTVNELGALVAWVKREMF